MRSPAMEEELLIRWEALITSVVRSTLRNPADWDDGDQVGRISLLQNYEKFPGGNREAWLRTILRRDLLDFCTNWRRPERDITLIDAETVEAMYGSTPLDGVQSAALGHVEFERMMGMIANRDFAAAIYLVHIVGLTYPEAGNKLGIPAGTVKSRVFRGLQALRLEMDDVR